MTQATIGRWGKSLAVRLPNEIASELGLNEGERVEIESGPEQITLRRARPHYTLGRLFTGKTPQEWRAIYSGAYDWGPDVGQEIIQE